MKNTAIVMAAFGTTTKALETYNFIGKIVRERFPGHDIRWAYSSRMVRDWIKQRRNIDLKHPHEVIAELLEDGHQWAVVQSVHLVCGHEFYRLTEEVRNTKIRSSIGLPLLSSPQDYRNTARVLCNDFSGPEDEAVVFVGHGTDHPAWAAYIAMNQVFSENIAKSGEHRRVYIGMVEGESLSPESLAATLKKDGIKKVCLKPMMMVAGVHFEEDLASDEEDSWKSVFESEGIAVSLENRGIGLNPQIADIFCRHIQDALDVIPDSHNGDRA